VLGGTSQSLSPVTNTVRSPFIGMGQVSSGMRYSSESMGNLSLFVLNDVSEVSICVALEVSDVSLSVFQLVG